jgi:hypothetical protein
MGKHKDCLYPNCTCITRGATCRVAEAAEKESYCSLCGATDAEIQRGECDFFDRCSRGDAVMINPIETAKKAWARP